MTWTVTTHYIQDVTHTWCLTCDFYAEGTDVRLPAIQHTKQTGHSTRVTRDILEAIEPDKEEEPTNG